MEIKEIYVNEGLEGRGEDGEFLAKLNHTQNRKSGLKIFCLFLYYIIYKYNTILFGF